MSKELVFKTGGNTAQTLDLFKKNILNYGGITSMQHFADTDHVNYITKFYAENATLVFDGFATGYGGAGPSGFVEALQFIGVPNKVAVGLAKENVGRQTVSTGVYQYTLPLVIKPKEVDRMKRSLRLKRKMYIVAMNRSVIIPYCNLKSGNYKLFVDVSVPVTKAFTVMNQKGETFNFLLTPSMGLKSVKPDAGLPDYIVKEVAELANAGMYYYVARTHGIYHYPIKPL